MGLISLLADLLNISGAPDSPWVTGTAGGSLGPMFGGNGPGGPPLTDDELGMGPGTGPGPGLGPGDGPPGGPDDDPPSEPDEQDECE